MNETKPAAPAEPTSRCVMVIEDDPSFGELLRYQLQRENYDVHIVRSGEEGLNRLNEIEPHVILLDVMLPGKDGTQLLGEIHPVHPEIPIVMMTAAGSVEMAVDCMKRGAYDFLTKPFDFDRLNAILRNALQYKELKTRVQALEGQLVKAHGFDQIIAHAPTMRQVVDQARRASLSDSDVLILGESGSGKEVLARAIHFNSSRKKGPFVAINCGAIPESLLESELFGHEKGAFTGAIGRRAGCFEQADGGTLFLDEIGEMRPDMQVRLLRALENREIRRVGGDRTIKVNTRVVSATNQNIQANIKHNLFRTDLYYRLAILVLEVPPLRDRRDDVGPLAQHFLDEARKDGHTRATRISPQALDVLMRYPWPGNVRELRNAIERAVVFEDTFMIMPASLPPEILRISLGPQAVPPPKLTETYTAEQFKAMLAQSNQQRDRQQGVNPDASIVQPLPAIPAPSPTGHQGIPGMTPPPGSIPVPAGPVTVPGIPGSFDPAVLRGPSDGEVLTLDEEEKRIILRTLSITGGNISDAARRLGVHRSTLHRKMTRYGLATDEQLAADTAGADEA
ncbi:MAG TPA: sigma-54 dependent transcriptional regulator [Planctomycetota bacterium]|nr:sigma-54 dependent transcriptional regulator [Planctomycetota bacterium]